MSASKDVDSDVNAKKKKYRASSNAYSDEDNKDVDSNFDVEVYTNLELSHLRKWDHLVRWRLISAKPTIIRSRL